MQNDLLNNNVENIVKRKVGRPKKEPIEIIKQHKYKLIYNNTEYFCHTLKEISVIVNRSTKCLQRIIYGHTTFKKKTSVDLKEIQIEKIKI